MWVLHQWRVLKLFWLREAIGAAVCVRHAFKEKRDSVGGDNWVGTIDVLDSVGGAAARASKGHGCLWFSSDLLCCMVQKHGPSQRDLRVYLLVAIEQCSDASWCH